VTYGFYVIVDDIGGENLLIELVFAGLKFSLLKIEVQGLIAYLFFRV